MAQEEFFKPHIEVAPTKTPVGGQQVYSFARLEPEFTAICSELEQAGRRERIVKIAARGADTEKECISCRSFWKMIVAACGRMGPKPTRTPKGSPKAAKFGAESEEGTPPPESAVSTPVAIEEGHPSKKRQEEHYPTVVFIDQLSRFSTSMYESDKGEGMTARMLQYFAKTVRETQGMSAAEREYYDIFLTYLLAAWDGRVDRTKLPTPTPSSELRDIFDFN
jgi:hypothetical protein